MVGWGIVLVWSGALLLALVAMDFVLSLAAYRREERLERRFRAEERARRADTIRRLDPASRREAR